MTMERILLALLLLLARFNCASCLQTLTPLINALDLKPIFSIYHSRCITSVAKSALPTLLSSEDYVKSTYATVDHLKILPPSEILKIDRLLSQVDNPHPITWFMATSPPPSTLLSHSQILNIENVLGSILGLPLLTPLTPKTSSSLSSLQKIIQGAITNNGNGNSNSNSNSKYEISSEKYPALASLRSNLSSLNNEIDSKLTKYEKEFKVERTPTNTILSPSRTIAKSIGEIKSTSRSKSNVYVLPFDVRELSERGEKLSDEIERLESLIILELSELIFSEELNIRLGLTGAAHLDSILARSKLPGYCPTLPSSPIVDIKSYRHPLLPPHPPPITNDLTLGSTSSGLIITGLNGGGKSVVLKSFALAALFTRLAFPIEAEETPRVSFFDEIYVDIGDGQSLDKGESTYAGHLENYAKILEGVRGEGAGSGNCLVCLDEMGR